MQNISFGGAMKNFIKICLMCKKKFGCIRLEKHYFCQLCNDKKKCPHSSAAISHGYCSKECCYKQNPILHEMQL